MDALRESKAYNVKERYMSATKADSQPTPAATAKVMEKGATHKMKPGTPKSRTSIYLPAGGKFKSFCDFWIVIAAQTKTRDKSASAIPRATIGQPEICSSRRAGPVQILATETKANDIPVAKYVPKVKTPRTEVKALKKDIKPVAASTANPAPSAEQPSVKLTLSEDEMSKYGDRCPEGYEKIELLGRYATFVG